MSLKKDIEYEVQTDPELNEAWWLAANMMDRKFPDLKKNDPMYDSMWKGILDTTITNYGKVASADLSQLCDTEIDELIQWLNEVELLYVEYNEPIVEKIKKYRLDKEAGDALGIRQIRDVMDMFRREIRNYKIGSWEMISYNYLPREAIEYVSRELVQERYGHPAWPRTEEEKLEKELYNVHYRIVHCHLSELSDTEIDNMIAWMLEYGFLDEKYKGMLEKKLEESKSDKIMSESIGVSDVVEAVCSDIEKDKLGRRRLCVWNGNWKR